MYLELDYFIFRTGYFVVDILANIEMFLIKSENPQANSLLLFFWSGGGGHILGKISFC